MKIQPKETLKRAGVNIGGDLHNEGEITVEGEKLPKTQTDQQKAEAFAKEYQALCEKHGYNIVVVPAFIARDDGTFSVKLQHSIGKMPKLTS